ncbi:exodeoxyribonuclease VII small subunit [Halothiobacillus sp.]|jgi:exodeoxyribonuclease VII small subunit|uniref:exodeoxyribonuclease VII small subunit n=1 Tax=Halothiobacillus sp. TaxID=1891311 RepID=UPI002AD275CD|nr:exodeoxyribonuclease VII small subunit [Halothiobacillus sp.]
MAVRKTAANTKIVQAGNPEVIAQYEQAMAELEQIVTRLEQGEQTLEQSLADYERGTQLARQCEQALKEAERRIDALSTADTPDPIQDSTSSAKDFFQ